MRKLTIVTLACLSLGASPAAAQSMSDDLRCFLLANGFAKQASDPKARQIAAVSLGYYMGRLDARADAATIARNLRKEGATIDPKIAGALMTACANRMAHSEQAIHAAASTAVPAK